MNFLRHTHNHIEWKVRSLNDKKGLSDHILEHKLWRMHICTESIKSIEILLIIKQFETFKLLLYPLDAWMDGRKHKCSRHRKKDEKEIVANIYCLLWDSILFYSLYSIVQTDFASWYNIGLSFAANYFRSVNFNKERRKLQYEELQKL